MEICKKVLDRKELERQDNIIMICFSRERPTHPFIYDDLYDSAVDYVEEIISQLECTLQNRQILYFLFKMLGISRYVRAQMKIFEAFFDNTPPTPKTLLVNEKIKEIEQADSLSYISEHTDFDECCEYVKQVYLMKYSYHEITRRCVEDFLSESWRFNRIIRYQLNRMDI